MDQPSDQDYLAAGSILPNPRGIASTNVQENPDVAAQSVALSKQTGVPAPVIHADPDRFSEQLKAQSAGDIVANNPQLQRYVSSDPMAAKVSSDDWAQLDETSQAVGKLSHPGIFQAMGQGWAEGWDYKGQQDALNEIVNAYDSPAWRAFATHVLGLGRAVFDVPTHAISGVVQAGISGLTQAFANAGDTDLYHSIFGEMASGAPERFGRDLNVLAQTLMMETHSLGATKEAQAEHVLTIHPKHLEAAADLADKVKPFIQDGKDIPVGVHQVTDQVKAEEAKTDIDSLKEATKAAQASATRERSPEMFRDFIAQHVGEDTIGISADAALKLYGNKVPEANDGLLGFVPDMADQLLRAAITGEDVKISKADWLTYIDPKVANDIAGDVRVRAQGLTQEEANNLPKYEEAAPKSEPDQFLDQMSIKYGAETDMSQWAPEDLNQYNNLVDKEMAKQASNYTLREQTDTDTFNSDFKESRGEGWHLFNIMDGQGGHIGDIELNKKGETLEVHWVGKPITSEGFEYSVESRDVGTFGPSALRKLLKQLREIYPDVTKIEGERVSGAREAARSGKGFLGKREKTSFELPADPVTKAVETVRQASGLKVLDIPGGEIKPSAVGINADQAVHNLEDVEYDGRRIIRVKGYTKEGTTDPIDGSLGVPGLQYDEKDGAINILGSYLLSSERGKGIGTAMYRQLFDKAAVEGKIVNSDYDISKSALAVYKKLEREGYRIEYAKDLHLGIDDGYPDKYIPGDHDEYTVRVLPGKLSDTAKVDSVPASKPAITPSAIGISQDQAARYQKLIAAQQSADHSAALARAEAFERRQQTPEWKANEKEMREEVATEVTQQPRFMADQAIRNGDIGKLNADSLTEEQRASLPSSYYKRNGESPDLVARVLGYSSGDDLIKDLAVLQQERRQAMQLVVARKMPDNTIRYGKPGQIHADLMDESEIVPNETMGFATPGGEFLDRQQALKHVEGTGGKSGVPKGTKDFKTYEEAFGLEAGKYNAANTMKPGEYLKSVINSETSRRMEEKYGKLEENILQTAKEQVLTETQLDLLHAELETLAGGKLNFTKDQLRQNAAEAVGGSKLSTISSDSFLASAGRAGRAAEDALLKGDPSEAFRQRQRQYASTMYAKEAMKIEKAKIGFDKLTKKYQKRDIKGRAPEYISQIQHVLVRLGQGVPRSVQNILEDMQKNGMPTLVDFDADRSMMGRNIFAPDFILDPNFAKPVNDLTGAQFMAASKMVKAMDFHARNENKIIMAGEKADKIEIRDRMIEQLKELGPAKQYGTGRAEELQSNLEAVKSFWWAHIIPEKMFNRIDKGDPLGLFSSVFTRMFTEAANFKEREIKDYDVKISSIFKSFGNLSKNISNDLWKDPLDETGRQSLPMTREDLFGILQHVGNAGNRDKLFRGLKMNPEAGMQWVWDQLRKDGDPQGAITRAQKIGGVLNELHEKVDNMSRQVNGQGVDRIALDKLQTPWGIVDEWYHPLSEDKLRGKYNVQRGEKDLFGDGHYDSVRASTPQGHTIERTGAIYPVDTKLSIVPIRMNQMIHDYTMRPSIVQLSKFFYDDKFMKAFKSYYGDHQAEALQPFLRDMANVSNYRSQAEQIGNRWLSYYTNNMVSTMVGANIGTIAKHNLTAGIKNFLRMPIGFTQELLSMATDPLTGERNWKLAHDKSDEVARRHQNMQELFSGQGADIQTYRGDIRGRFQSLRSTMMWAGSTPLAFIDSLFSAATFNAVYKKALFEGHDEGTAKYLADLEVRTTHGSSVFTNKPEVARSRNALTRTYAQFFNFFIENLQNVYEGAWRAKDFLGLVKEGNIAEATKQVPKVGLALFTSLIIPGIVDYMISPPSNNKNESWGQAATDVLLGTVSGGFFGVRDLVHGLISGQTPGGGLLPEMFKTIADPIHDLATHKAFTPSGAGKFLKDAITMTGLATGLTNRTEGNIAEGVYNYFHNREHVQNLWQAAEVARYGKTKGHSKSFDDWLKHEVPK